MALNVGGKLIIHPHAVHTSKSNFYPTQVLCQLLTTKGILMDEWA
jgi:hypothetical protein